MAAALLAGLSACQSLTPAQVAGHWVFSDISQPGWLERESPAHHLPRRGMWRTLALEPDGSAMYVAPGANDAPVHTPGTWKLKGHTITLQLQDGSIQLLQVEGDSSMFVR